MQFYVDQNTRGSLADRKIINPKMDFSSFLGQAKNKRQIFRMQIRRRAIEQYQQRVRQQWSINSTSNGSEEDQKIQLYHCDQRRNDSREYKQNAMLFEHVPLMKEEVELVQIMEHLEQMQLTHPSELCTSSCLGYLESLIKQRTVGSTCAKINRIFTKISINELYWDEEFLRSFIGLLQCCIGQQIEVLQYLSNLSDCNILDFKVTVYKLIMEKNIIDPYLQTPKCSIVRANTPRSKIIQIISNLLIAPPMVSHLHPSLCDPTHLPFDYISKLMGILTELSGSVCSDSKKSYNKQQYQLLELFYGLCSRLQCRQMDFILTWMHRHPKKWRILENIMQRYLQDSTHSIQGVEQPAVDNIGGAMQTKLKFKLFQIYQIIMQFCLYRQEHRRVGLQLIYDLLPHLLSITVDDINNFMARRCHKTAKMQTKYWQSSPIEERYQTLILKVIYSLVNMKDQLGQLPALNYIAVRYPTFFQDITQHYCLGSSESKMVKIAMWICQIVIGNSVDACSLEWVSNFICHMIAEHEQTNNKNQALLSILESVLYTVCNHQHQDSRCHLLRMLREQRVVKKLQEIVIVIREDCDYINKQSTDTELIESIDSLLKFIYDQQKPI